jgi:hypothetical protein
MESHPMIIRAPGLYRLVNVLNSFNPKNVPGIAEILAENSVIESLVNFEPAVCFPTHNMSDMSFALTKVLQCYIEKGAIIHEKILMLSLLEKAYKKFSRIESTTVNKKTREIIELSKSFYDISKNISGKDFTSSSERIYESNGLELEKDREYLCFTVTV